MQNTLIIIVQLGCALHKYRERKANGHSSLARESAVVVADALLRLRAAPGAAAIVEATGVGPDALLALALFGALDPHDDTTAEECEVFTAARRVLALRIAERMDACWPHDFEEEAPSAKE
jgi:hypothetical protein